MKERGLPLPVERVQALQRGATQFRFPVKPQPGKEIRFFHHGGGALWLAYAKDKYGQEYEIKCPYGQPGDHLWVRETWSVHEALDDLKPSLIKGGASLFDCRTDAIYYRSTPPLGAGGFIGKWRPSIFMPRWASRYLLEVVSVRLERVRDITPADARAEGAVETNHVPVVNGSGRAWCGDIVAGFRAFWNSMFAKKGFAFDSDPWAWVVEHRRIEG